MLLTGNDEPPLLGVRRRAEASLSMPNKVDYSRVSLIENRFGLHFNTYLYI
jgi:hypothetical protein